MTRTKQHLYDPLFEQQGGKCALCGTEIDNPSLAQIDRFPIRGEDNGAYVLENTRLICLVCDWEQEGNAPDSPKPQLATAYRVYKFWQDKAGAAERQIKAFRGEVKGMTRSPYFTEPFLEVLDEELQTYQEREKTAQRMLEHMVRLEPEWAWMKHCPGLGEITAAFLLSRVDIRKAQYVSSLWSFLGYVPNKEGGYNPGKGELKAALYAALSIFVMRKDGLYRQDYDREKAKHAIEGKHSGHAQAINRVTKLWLSHLWETWRKAEGLPTPAAYALNHLGHTGTIFASKRGWPSQI